MMNIHRVIPDPNKSSSTEAADDLETLLRTLEVSLVMLVECLVAPGWRLDLGGTDAPAIHYCVAGSGRLIVSGRPPVELRRHTLVIVPKNTPFTLESDDIHGNTATRTVKGTHFNKTPCGVRQYAAGEGGFSLEVICGYFRASYGQSLSLFGPLQTPIIEHFDERDRLDLKLREAIDELVDQKVGAMSMTAGLLKLVLIPLVRRSLLSRQMWIERFGLLRDPRISRAFAEMAARPSLPHTIASLADAAGLSRSVFVSLFRDAFGQPPMTVLRELRMRHAAALLSTRALAIDQIASAAGYESRSSFSRAFRRAFGTDPTRFRGIEEPIPIPGEHRRNVVPAT